MSFPVDQMGFQLYDTYVKTVLSDVTFRGFTASSSPYDPASDAQAFYWPDKRGITSLIHSDYFKPQGISATIRVKFENSDRQQIFGHKRIETGSARYFNLIDADGSFGTAGTAQIIGSGNGWWNFDSTCVYEPTWYLYRCTKGSREIVNLDYIIPGTVDTSTYDLPPVPANYIGQTYLFGPGISAGRNATLTRNPGVTGVGKTGWYFHTTQGSPKTFSVIQAVNPSGQYVIGAWKYASGTTFTINLVADWGRGTTAVTPVNTFNELLNGDGAKYYFDGSHLYIKMINNQNDWANRKYTRSGVSIWDVIKAVHYDVTANCANANGAWCPSSYVHPTAWS